MKLFPITDRIGFVLKEVLSFEYFVLKIIKPWEVTDFSASGARERRLIQKFKQP